MAVPEWHSKQRQDDYDKWHRTLGGRIAIMDIDNSYLAGGQLAGGVKPKLEYRTGFRIVGVTEVKHIYGQPGQPLPDYMVRQLEQVRGIVTQVADALNVPGFIVLWYQGGAWVEALNDLAFGVLLGVDRKWFTADEWGDVIKADFVPEPPVIHRGMTRLTIAPSEHLDIQLKLPA